MADDDEMVTLNVRLTRGERKQIKRNARWFGMERSEFIRFALQGSTLDAVGLRKKARDRRRAAVIPDPTFDQWLEIGSRQGWVTFS